MPNPAVDFPGVTIADSAVDDYGIDTEIIPASPDAGFIDNPFRIVGTNFATDDTDVYIVRFSSDSGGSWYDNVMFSGNKREANAAPSGTEHIFNRGTRISASCKTLGGADGVDVWLEIQEI